MFGKVTEISGVRDFAQAVLHCNSEKNLMCCCNAPVSIWASNVRLKLTKVILSKCDVNNTPKCSIFERFHIISFSTVISCA